VTSSSQRPVPDNTQHSQQTDIHAPGGIRAHNLSRRAAVDLRLRPRGKRHRHALLQRLILTLYSLVCHIRTRPLIHGVGSFWGRARYAISCRLGNPMIQRQLCNTLPRVPILSQMNPLHTLPFPSCYPPIYTSSSPNSSLSCHLQHLL